MQRLVDQMLEKVGKQKVAPVVKANIWLHLENIHCATATASAEGPENIIACYSSNHEVDSMQYGCCMIISFSLFTC